MRSLWLILSVIVISGGGAALALPTPPVWTPTAADVSKLEGKLKFGLPKPLGEARRVYGGRYRSGHREIVGRYTWRDSSFWSGPAGVEIVSDGNAMWIADGGCGVFNVWYDADADQIIRAMCGDR